MASLLALVGDMHHWRFSTFICPREIMRPSGTRTDKRSIREVTLKIILANSPRLVSHLSTGGKIARPVKLSITACSQAHYYNINDKIQLCSLQLSLFIDFCFSPWPFMIRIYVVSNATVSAIRKHNVNVILHLTIDKSFIPFVLPSASSSSTTIIISIINFVVEAIVSIIITSSSYFS